MGDPRLHHLLVPLGTAGDGAHVLGDRRVDEADLAPCALDHALLLHQREADDERPDEGEQHRDGDQRSEGHQPGVGPGGGRWSMAGHFRAGLRAGGLASGGRLAGPGTMPGVAMHLSVRGAMA